ncbi:MAG: class I SAM-dependent methyltransferase [Planctomycetota bacterium]
MTAHSTRPPTLRGRIGAALGGVFCPPDAAAYTRRVVEHTGCATALDIGCGVSSHLTALRPTLKSYGIDIDRASIEASRERNVHDGYAVGDIIRMPIEELRTVLRQSVGVDRFDVVTAYGLIEHLPKRAGWELLEKCEALSSKCVVVETPNGFVPQGPEFGNPFQRHLSGWFPDDFRSVGYTVRGTTGTRYVRGYMGLPRLPVPGALLFDQAVLSRVLRIHTAPRHAFNLLAVKDVRGVPARYASREEFRRRQRMRAA